MLEQLKAQEKVIGVKQSRRAVLAELAKLVFVASDADPALTEPLEQMCCQRGIPVVDRFTMSELGQAAGIQVGAAVAAVLK